MDLKSKPILSVYVSFRTRGSTVFGYHEKTFVPVNLICIEPSFIDKTWPHFTNLFDKALILNNSSCLVSCALPI